MSFQYYCPDDTVLTTTTEIPTTAETERMTTITDPIEPADELVVSMLLKAEDYSVVISGVEDELTGVPEEIVTTIETPQEARRRRKRRNARRKRQITEREEVREKDRKESLIQCGFTAGVAQSAS